MNAQAQQSTLDSLIDGLAARGEQPLVLAFTADAPEVWSHARAGEQIQALARGIQQRVEPGEPVVLLGDDRPPWFIAALGIVRAGAVATPLDVQLTDDQLARVLEDSNARWAFTTRMQQGRIHEAAPGMQTLLLDAGQGEEADWRGWMTDTEALPSNPPDQTAVLFYTSGTTGPPKGVPLSHANLAFQLDALEQAGIVRADDRVLLPLPLHHVYPFVIGMLGPMALGLTLVVPHALTGPQVLRALREGKASVVIGVPRFYASLYSGIRDQAERSGRVAAGLFRAGLGLGRAARNRFGLRPGKWLLRPLHRQVGMQLRVLASGGSALDSGLARNLEALGWQVATGYGLTETAPLLTLDPPGHARPGTVGRPLPGLELRIDTAAAPEGERDSGQGEILARGPNVFRGYRNQPEKTREALTDDGWFRTGDLGWLDADGYLHISGRVSTLIVTAGGENIQPDQLEERYAAHAAIREIGILQDEEERLVGLIVPASEAGDSPRDRIAEVLRTVGRELPSYQRLDNFALTRKPLPHTRLGKIQRHHLKARYREATEQQEAPASTEPLSVDEMASEDRTLLEYPAARSAWDWLSERYPDRALTPDTGLQLELGIDSLEALNLTLELGQRTGVELDDAALGHMETVRDLLRELIDAGEQDSGGVDPLADPEQYLDADRKRWLQPRTPTQQVAARALYGLDLALTRGLLRLRVQGREQVPEEGPLLLTCTHASHLDPFAVAAALSFERLRSLYWGGWTGVVFNTALRRWLSRVAQAVPIDPRHGVRTSLALAGAVLQREQGLIWFPEGQRSQDGELQPLRAGVGMLLERFPVPVVPVSIRGTHESMPPGTHLPRPCPVTVRFGTPVQAEQLARNGEGESHAERIRAGLEQRLRALHAAAA